MKTLKKFSFYHVGAFESYLSGMAKKGLLLKNIKGRQIIFEKDEPRAMEYRMEFGKDGLNDDIMEEYKSGGWTFVTEAHGFHIFQARTAQSFQEVRQSGEVYRTWVTKLYSEVRSNFLMRLISILLAIGAAVFKLNVGGTPNINFLEGGLLYIMLVLLALDCAVFMIDDISCCREIRAVLQKNIAFKHHEDWKNRTWIRNVYRVITVFVFGIALFILGDAAFHNGHYIEEKQRYDLYLETNLTIPVVRLNDIEQLKNPELSVTYISDDENWNNIVLEDKMLFVNHYNVIETFKHGEAVLVGNSVQPLLRTSYYDVKIPFFASGVFDDVVNREKDSLSEQKDVKMETLAIEGFERVYYLECDELSEKIVILKKNNQVVRSRYIGMHSKDEVLEAVTNALK